MSHTVSHLFDLSGRCALVTGGARHLGYDMAEALAESGADVAITSRRFDDAQASAQRLHEATGRQILPLALDVSDEEQVQAVVAQTLEHFGQIDILVNNAGNVVSTPENAPLECRPSDLWKQTLAVNLDGVFYCTKHVLALAMKPAQRGAIINIGSTVGIIGKDRRVYEGTSMGGRPLIITLPKVR